MEGSAADDTVRDTVPRWHSPVHRTGTSGRQGQHGQQRISTTYSMDHTARTYRTKYSPSSTIRVAHSPVRGATTVHAAPVALVVHNRGLMLLLKPSFYVNPPHRHYLVLYFVQWQW